MISSNGGIVDKFYNSSVLRSPLPRVTSKQFLEYSFNNFLEKSLGNFLNISWQKSLGTSLVDSLNHSSKRPLENPLKESLKIILAYPKELFKPSLEYSYGNSLEKSIGGFPKDLLYRDP